MDELKEKAQYDIKIAQKLISLRDRANYLGKDFDITFSFLKRLKSRKTCQYTGMRFDDGENSLSIERVDSDKGYTQNNVVAVSERINKAKNNFTYDDLKLILKAIEEHQKLLEEQE